MRCGLSPRASVIMLLWLSFLCLPLWAQEYPDFAPVINQTGKSVVNIITITNSDKQLVPDDLRNDLENTPLMDVLKQLFGDKLEENLSGRGPGLASGTIISADGYVVTNYHVVDNANEIYVRLQDRREFPAKVIGSDAGTDLALLKIDAKNLPYLNYANSDQIKVGEWVLAIGSPFGFENTVTVGVVSATGRSLGSERYVPFIQTDTAINPGNSGGPLLNLKGEIVGINSQIITESGGFSGLSFAVPANVVKLIVEQLKAHGSISRGWLGLAFQDLNRDLADSFGLGAVKGALVSKVIPDSPAAKAGVKVGDIIVQLDGKEVIKAADLPPIVGLIPVDSHVDMKIIRQQSEMQVSLTLSKYVPSKQVALKDTPRDPKIDKLQTEIAVRDLETFEQTGLADAQGGVMVIAAKGKAWLMAGVHRGDIIISVNNKPIINTQQFYETVRNMDSSRAVPVLVVRPGDVQRYLAVRLDKYDL